MGTKAITHGSLPQLCRAVQGFVPLRAPHDRNTQQVRLIPIPDNADDGGVVVEDDGAGAGSALVERGRMYGTAEPPQKPG